MRLILKKILKKIYYVAGILYYLYLTSLLLRKNKIIFLKNYNEINEFKKKWFDCLETQDHYFFINFFFLCDGATNFLI